MISARLGLLMSAVTIPAVIGTTLLVSSGAQAQTQPPVAAPAVTTPAAPAAPAAEVIPNSYIVRTKPARGGQAAASTVAVPEGVQVTEQYSAAITGFAAQMSPSQAEQLRHQPNVLSVEPNVQTHLWATPAPTVQKVPAALWSLDRVNQTTLPLDGQYTYRSTGKGVRAYVVDVGIDVTDKDFGGRAQWSFDVFGQKSLLCPRNPGVSVSDHATHVAGTLAGTTYGVAKAVQLRSVRVVNCYGFGDVKGFLAGIDFIAKDMTPGVPTVVNMSMGFSGPDAASEAAIRTLLDKGAAVVVAAGNDPGYDYCKATPNSADPRVIVVGAHGPYDVLSPFSSLGKCVDLFAPGENIVSDLTGNRTGTMDGTSMASPHVAGAMALLMGDTYKYDSGRAWRWLRNNSLKGAVHGLPAGTANRMLYKGAI